MIDPWADSGRQRISTWGALTNVLRRSNVPIVSSETGADKDLALTKQINGTAVGKEELELFPESGTLIAEIKSAAKAAHVLWQAKTRSKPRRKRRAAVWSTDDRSIITLTKLNLVQKQAT